MPAFGSYIAKAVPRTLLCYCWRLCQLALALVPELECRLSHRQVFWTEEYGRLLAFTLAPLTATSLQPLRLQRFLARRIFIT